MQLGIQNSESRIDVRSLRRGLTRPLDFLQQLSARGDFVQFSIGAQRAFLLNRPDYVEDVLVTSASKFAKGAANLRAKHLLGNGLLTAEGPLHDERRQVIQPAFARKRFDEFVPAIVRRTEALCDSWRDGALIDVGDAMGRLTFGVIGETVIGARVDELYADVRRAVQHATRSLDALVSLLAPLRRVRPQHERLARVVDALLEISRRQSSGADTLIALLLGDGNGAITRQVQDDLLTILLAGHDTLSNALTWLWVLVGTRPDVVQTMREEIVGAIPSRPATAADVGRLAYTRAVLAESLRLYPPAWIIARQALDNHELEGGVVPRGALVVVSQFLLHRDRRYFDDPLAFEPERWLPHRQNGRPRMSYFPFGAGGRSCIGEAFGWMEGVTILATMVRRWTLRALSAQPPAIDPRITLRPQGPVVMRVEQAVG